MMKQRTFTHLLALFVSLAVPAAFAANEGTAVGVKPDAVARLSATDRILEVGADVSVGETIITGTSGVVQIIFDDDTRLVVGPRSALVIETYLLANSNTVEKLTINALGGSFRFITGNSPKPAYSINTPTASIAVRGTKFDIIALPSTTRVMLYEGALQICNTSGGCEDLTQRCDVAEVGRREADLYVRNDPKRAPLSLEFRYAKLQSPLLPDFRVEGAAVCVDEGTPESFDPGKPPPPPRRGN